MRSSFSRREFLRLGGVSLAGAATLGTAACGGGGASGDIVFSMGPDATGNLQELVRRFNEQSEGFQAIYREQPAQTEQYFDNLRTQFQAGGGDIDVIGGDVIWPAQFAANGWLLDVSDRFTEDMRSGFLEGPVESLVYEDGIYGVPWFTDAGMLYYRLDLLEEAGFSEPPSTWEEMKEMAQRVQRDRDVRFGFVFQGASYEGGTVNGLEYIWTHGGDVLDPEDPTRVIIDGPESVEGLATQRSMVADGITPQAVATYAEMDSHAAFLNGDAVLIRNWPYMYALAGNPDESNIEREQVGVAPLPAAEGEQTSSALGGWNLMINAASEKQDQAWEFVEFMTNEASQRFRATEATILPTRASLYDDPE
ncbi:MAG: ABC transporter substrate-binding protein, partial [Rubrobacteraceae bacterium]